MSCDGTASAQGITFNGVTRTFRSRDGSALLALDTVRMGIGRGEFCAILGPSGCGKTSLLRMVAGLLEPSTGQVLVASEPVLRPRPDVGVVFQQALLLPWLNVIDNVLIPVDLQGRDRRDFVDRAHNLVRMVGLAGFEKRYPAELSGGMQQRVALARGLVLDPAVLLMDEPFAALDAMTRESMNYELQRIWAETGKTVLFVTHSIPEAVFLADRVAVMTARPGRVAGVFDVDFPRLRTTALLGTPEFSRRVADIRTVFEHAHDNHATPESAPA